MQKLLTFTCLLILASCSTEIPDDQLVSRENITYKINSTTPYTGSSVGYHENEQLRLKKSYKDGKPDGLMEAFHDNGQLQTKVIFKEGKMEGLMEAYYSDGKLFWQGNFIGGREEGLHEKYYPNGVESFLHNYKNGAREGLQSDYYRNGQIKEETNFENNKMVMEKSFSDDGTPIRDLTYDYIDGEISVSGIDILDSNGVKGTVTWKNGLLEGEAETFVDSRPPSMFHGKGSFKNNKMDGIWEFWDKRGKKNTHVICFRENQMVDMISAYEGLAGWEDGKEKNATQLAESIEAFVFYCGNSKTGNMNNEQIRKAREATQ